MARIVLTAWFAVATLLGPGMCCCLLSAHGQSAPATAAAKPERPKCQHCAKKKDTSAPSKPTPRPECPCKKGSGECHATVRAAPQSTEDKLVRQLATDLFGALNFDTPTIYSLRSAVPGVLSVISFPFHDTDDLLYACHILRC